MGGRSTKPSTEGAPGADAAKQFDPTFNGPIKDRGCTDVICCFLFLLFVLAFIGVGIFAFASGDPRYLIYPTDSRGNLCGSGEFKDKRYLFFFDLVACFLGTDKTKLDVNQILQFGCNTPQVCVSSCPNTTWTPITGSASNAICQYGVKVTSENIWQLIANRSCAPYYVTSVPIVDRCMPSLIPAVVNSIDQHGGFQSNNQTINSTDLATAASQLQFLLNIGDYGTKILGDVTASWWLILIFVIIAAVVSLIWMLLMRWLAGIIVWLSLLLFAGFFGFGIYYCFDKYVHLKASNSTVFGSSTPLTQYTNFDYYINLYQTWLALGIISCIVLGVVLLVVLFLRTRLMIAIALIKEASRAVGSMMFCLLWPFIPYLLQLAVLAYWGASAICLAAISKSAYCTIGNTSSPDAYTNARCSVTNFFDSVIPCNTSASGASGSVCSYVKHAGGDSRYTLVLQAFQLFVWLWLMNFIIALAQVTLSGAFASYYWTFNKPHDLPSFPITYALGRAMRYHVGSMAFGALIIAIIQFIRIMLEYMHHKLSKAENSCAKFLLKCCMCCFWCLEKFMKFINKNAYIMIAIHGKNFCRSAMDAFSLIFRNLIRVVVVDKVTDFILFISKLFIVGSIGVLAYFFFAREIPGVRDVIPTPNLTFYLVPVLIIIGATYVVATAFLQIYSQGVETLFLCFLEDLERNDGSAEKPYFMNKELMNILGKTNSDKAKKSRCCC